MASMKMNLSFAPNEEDDILNTTVRDSDTGSVMYTIDTPRRIEGTLTTAVTRRNRIDGSARLAFQILWKGAKGSLEDVKIILDFTTFEEISVRDVLGSAPGSATYGSVNIDDTEYRWKSKGTGSKVVLVKNDTNDTVAQSHSRIRNSIFKFKKPRDMSLEISPAIADAVDIVLLTFILVWRERQNERAKTINDWDWGHNPVPLSPLDGIE